MRKAWAQFSLAVMAGSVSAQWPTDNPTTFSVYETYDTPGQEEIVEYELENWAVASKRGNFDEIVNKFIFFNLEKN